MLSPVQLPIYPCCFDALAWSPDGELAVAAGEQIQVLTPDVGKSTSAPQRQETWQITRFRVNVFTYAEWADIYPQNRDDFSIGAEQSTSTILAMAWSPPGLARFRRSVLAVLTSNLILSFWEPIGPKRQWTRVGIVNHLFHENPSLPTKVGGEILRRVNIRSFQWCAPFKVPAPAGGSNSLPESESRWGIHMLAVATDFNDLALLRVRRSAEMQGSSNPYCVEKITLCPLDQEGVQFPMAGSGSILHGRIQSQVRVSSISCGPWIMTPASRKDDVHSVTAILTAVHGTQLRIFKASVTVRRSSDKEEHVPRYEVAAKLGDHQVTDLASKWNHQRVTGPIEWLYTNQDQNIALAVGITGGLLTISMRRSAYDGTSTKETQVQTRNWPFYEPFSEINDSPKRHWDPITAMTTSQDEEHGTCTLHVCTTGGLGVAVSLDQLDSDNDLQVPAWNKIVETSREQYDLNRDLGGHAVARMWGLTSYRGINAVLFTKHPTDMIEYRVASDEDATIAFASDEAGSIPDKQALIAPRAENQESRTAQSRREAVTSFLLSRDATATMSREDQKLIYAAACCGIVDRHNSAVRSKAQKLFDRLAKETGTDQSEEMAACESESSSIPAKSSHQLDQPGGYLFERCEICKAGIAWISATEAQCANGHLLARCGLTFLTIQEPGVSKYCSGCRTEYMDEALVAHVFNGQLFQELFETFDTCLYCDAKFQASI
ncbi:Transcription factor IIIC zinc-finger [Penicillium atrosanguineum]|uniref:Transcription factor IIIC zinc-finger n=1 Tax=Penicillium atrosanguineum TaxID=1132637 RepID=A0A9W9L475_9EURO|nr:Short-chain dehydrogenase/reductase SDR [Penicillium atrosanguineum]KAJ5125158.1 Transcription factor IIIC zinc-finger [Penicillium atrosanguineum]KAJ5135931.1 Transcription factor IIIC zinc-finger [Penicillium atrosanguineum]KAJ5292285.1 Short-chain dehydrogenase/reductase SDR [Penicillium atrosanguineum]KAJ5303696.1 Transcription factor IIIC zinc-finger [Penicillium atrosanguineum]